MPQNRSSAPPVMTWGKAAPVLAISLIFDALRFLFEWFVFFGPALAAIYCTAEVNAAIGTTVAGVAGKVVAGGCAVVAGAAGVLASEVTAVFGLVMAMVIGFAGWLAIGIIMLVSNGRVLRENLLLFVGSLAVSQVPFVNSLPALTAATWRMYHRQIQTEKAALEKWKREDAAAQLQMRNQQALQTRQIQQAQQAQIEEEQAVQGELDIQEQVAEQEDRALEESDEIPDETRKAA